MTDPRTTWAVARGGGAARAATESRGLDRRRHPGVVVVVGLLALSVGWFLVFGAWWLNSDGSTYLGTGRGVLNGIGFRLPDGSSPAWWNRPVFPVLIALPSLWGGGVEASNGRGP